MTNKTIYKEVDLFGGETLRIVTPKKKLRNLFSDYDGFVDKFKSKLTTDDCFTPQPIYDCVVDYVASKIDLSDRKIIRPFYPGGDYEAIDYPSNCIVIDNPPFSIISKIARFYIDNNILFFLFAPHLTLFGSDVDCTRIVCYADITYKNGARVKTSFLSNIFGNIAVMGDAELHKKLTQANKQAKQTATLPKYQYPANILTVSKVSQLVERGVSIEFNKSDLQFCRGLDSQKAHKKALFGSGFLISDKAAQAQARAQARAQVEDVIVWELSEREKNIIKTLG